MTLTRTYLDCLGKKCPAPILAASRAARELAGPGGCIEILADDDAFPEDIRSWCRSSGAKLLSLHSEGSKFRALVEIESSAQQIPTEQAGLKKDAMKTMTKVLPISERASAIVPPATNSKDADETNKGLQKITVDCRGMQCPAPILEVARLAQSSPGASFEILADDEAFPMDIESWARSTKSTLHEVEQEGNVYRAHITVVGAKHASTPNARASTSMDKPLPIGIPAPIQTQDASLHAETTVHPGATLDLRAFPSNQLESVLDQSTKALSGKLTIVLSDQASKNLFLEWCARLGHDLIALRGGTPIYAEVALSTKTRAATELVKIHKARGAILVLHNDKESLLAALMVANGAASSGKDVCMFFTFWGLNLLRGDTPNPAFPEEKASLAQRLFKWLMPKGPQRQALGKFNFGGVGGGMMARLMREKDIMDIPELLTSASDLGVRFIACTTSMKVMGITKREIHPYKNLNYAGVASFVEEAASSEFTLVF